MKEIIVYDEAGKIPKFRWWVLKRKIKKLQRKGEFFIPVTNKKAERQGEKGK